MPETEVDRAKRQVTLSCVRFHQTGVTTENPIDSDDFANEVCKNRCSVCGGFWFAATDGQNFRLLVQPMEAKFPDPPRGNVSRDDVSVA